jgi:hypothetical protein
VISLRRGEERIFHDIRIRAIRIEDGNPDDRNDDSIDLSISAPTGPQALSLSELNTQARDAYEYTAEDIIPSQSLF